MKQFLCLVVVCSALGSSSVSAEVHRLLDGSEPDLQSAFLHRSGSLQGHFSRILTLLDSWETAHLELALQRCESASVKPWSLEERKTRKAQLKAERHRNLDVLQEYGRRGKFPQNDGSHAPLTPIFVDASNTACAVGHMMRRSGESEAVAWIEETNNHVYVSEVTGGPLIDWIRTSGFIQEEAALIQPAYPIGPIVKRLNEMEDGTSYAWESQLASLTEASSETGVALEFHGLATTGSGSSEVESAELEKLFLGSDLLPVRGGFFRGPVYFETSETHYAMLGAWSDPDVTWMKSTVVEITDKPSLSASAAFTISAHDSKRWIEGITLHSDRSTDNLLPLGSAQGRIRVITTVYNDDDVVLGTAVLDTNEPGQIWSPDFRDGETLQAWSTINFNPVGSLRIESTVDLWGTAQFDALAMGVDVPRKPHSSITLRQLGRLADVNFTVRSDPNTVYNLHQSVEPGTHSEIVRTQVGTGDTISLEYTQNRFLFGRPKLKPVYFFWLTESELP